VKSLLHLSKFLVNANFHLVTKYISKTSFNNDYADYDYVKYQCQKTEVIIRTGTGIAINRNSQGSVAT